MNYIITGGTGFIGTHLTNLIKEQDKNAHVWNLDIVDPNKLDGLNEELRMKNEECSSTKEIYKQIEEYTTIKQWKSPVKDGDVRKSTFVYCDVRKPIENLPFTPTPDDIIFNFAAVHRTPGHPDHAYFETNIRGAENVCAFAEKWGIKNIVFTSSIAPYGAAEELKKETTLPTPNTPYGISKLVAEKIHLAWKASSPEHKLTIVRPGVVFGKGENGNFTRLYWAIRGHKFAYPGRKDTIKACIYVKELVRFIWWRANLNEECRMKNEEYGCAMKEREREFTRIYSHIANIKKSSSSSASFREFKKNIFVPWMICVPNEKEGRKLMAEIMQGGNFGQYDTRDAALKKGGMMKHGVWKLKRVMRLVRSYPEEALWEPVFRVYHLLWRGING